MFPQIITIFRKKNSRNS